MGLDIGLATINQQDWYQERDELFQKHRLSRQFCCLMLRRHNLDAGELAELEQLAHLTGVDITPLHAMDSYPTEEALEWKLESAGSEQERSEVMRQAEVDKVNLNGNLEVVLATVDALLDRLAALPDLDGVMHL